MDRIKDAFEKGKNEGRALFIAYICAGDPDEDTSFEVCRTLIEKGVDLLELGMPFSDPLADGLTNQLAAERALASGMTQEKSFRLVERLRAITDIPIIFYTYYNLVCARGIEHYVQAAKKAGVDGLLTLDLPPEESEELKAACDAAGLKTIFIVAPTTPESRLPIIAKVASGFIYYVSREGVTGYEGALAEGIGASVEKIKAYSDLPVGVGFGISQPDQVREVAAVADGVIVGSALVNCVKNNLGHPHKILATLSEKLEQLVPATRR